MISWLTISLDVIFFPIININFFSKELVSSSVKPKLLKDLNQPTKQFLCIPGKASRFQDYSHKFMAIPISISQNKYQL